MKSNLLRKRRITKYYLILPAAVLLIGTTVIPILYMLYTSLFRLDPVVFNGKWPFVGLGNYIDLIIRYPMFWSSLARTLKFLLYTVTLQIGVGLLLATLMYREFKGKRMVQTILLFPILLFGSPIDLDKKISLQFEEVPISTILTMIAQQHNLNIVQSSEISEEISLQLENVSLGDALRAILSSNGYNYIFH